MFAKEELEYNSTSLCILIYKSELKNSFLVRKSYSFWSLHSIKNDLETEAKQ